MAAAQREEEEKNESRSAVVGDAPRCRGDQGTHTLQSVRMWPRLCSESA